jgi:hypothetical protein
LSRDGFAVRLGVTRKLLTISGKAQGVEVSLDSDSLPFGVVVLRSRKSRKLVLENTGAIYFL